MNYPLIILGAGASFDSQNLEVFNNSLKFQLDEFRPPLTNDLFDRSKNFIDQLIEKYDEVADLSAYYGSSGVGIEPFLRGLLDNKESLNSSRMSQIISLNFYLADLFKKISGQFFKRGRGNNYAALLQAIYYKYGERACFINFNYDLLLEKNLPVISNVDSYVSQDLKIIKIHGACDWVYEKIVIGNEFNHAQKYFSKKADQFINYYGAATPKLIKDSIEWNYLEKKDESSQYSYMPALAIPVNGKHDHICPQQHIDVLKKCLPEIDKIVIIGWRGEDPFVLKLMADNLRQEIPTCIITKTGDDHFEANIKEFYKKSVPQLKITNIGTGGFTFATARGALNLFLDK